jgi:sulfur carrier protein
MSAEPEMTASPARISVNGEEEPLVAPTVAALLAQKEIAPDRRGVAVAVNGTVVPRTAWSSTPLHPGDRVEIVRVLQGG